jgi:hypothetical protein
MGGLVAREVSRPYYVMPKYTREASNNMSL